MVFYTDITIWRTTQYPIAHSLCRLQMTGRTKWKLFLFEPITKIKPKLSRHISHHWHFLHFPSTQPSLITQLFDQKAMKKLLFISNNDKNLLLTILVCSYRFFLPDISLPRKKNLDKTNHWQWSDIWKKKKRCGKMTLTRQTLNQVSQ